MLDSRNHQGKFAEDYVRVLASAAGLLVYRDDLDHDGIDLGFRYPGRAGRVSSPALEAQVKSCSAPRVAAGELLFDGLTEVQFNKLADGPFTVPRYLFVVIVPSDPHDYTRFETDGMLLRQLAYFLPFEDERPVAAPGRARRRVRVPLGNVLTARTLARLVTHQVPQPHPAAAPAVPVA
ncbi:DUF4365 domain-containing protein [Actinomadura flavalba]|uniref:DUF4365 domain-containing protein n=1 Tax=Actinomadura flavalba TaxID=1120938 RepID=UPI000377E888|nr:DUF4365 domain-containing protein [Actinomadura flavalba]